MFKSSTSQRQPILFAFALAASLALAGCKDRSSTRHEEGSQTTAASTEGTPSVLKTPPASEQDQTVYFLAADAAVSHQASQILLLQSLARASAGLGVQIMDAKGSKSAQTTQLQKVANLKPAAIIIEPVNAQDIAPDMQQTVASGVLLLSLDGQSPTTACSSALFVDQEKLGKRAGELVVNALTQKAKDEGSAAVTGRIVEFRGTDDSATCTARDRGFTAAIATQPGIVIVHDAPTNWSAKDTLTRFQDAVRLQKNFDVIYAHNDIIAQVASDAATAAGMREKIFIVGTDGLGGAGLGIEGLRANIIDATLYHPYLVDLAWRIIERHQTDPNFKPKARYEFETLVITSGVLDDLQRKGYPPAPPL